MHFSNMRQQCQIVSLCDVSFPGFNSGIWVLIASSKATPNKTQARTPLLCGE